ncbi:MAG: response regulator transcription factor [Anaerolineales bacterium]|nr:response regulator transcription factor [Anaerolineales bacterium]
MATIRVLLIDNNANFLELASDYLGSGEDVVVVGTALNYREALAQVSKLMPDVALLDIRMPSMNGLELLPRLRAMMPDLVIIILTMYDLDVYREAARNAGARGFVSKRNLVDDLLPAILRVKGDCCERV